MNLNHRGQSCYVSAKTWRAIGIARNPTGQFLFSCYTCMQFSRKWKCSCIVWKNIFIASEIAFKVKGKKTCVNFFHETLHKDISEYNIEYFSQKNLENISNELLFISRAHMLTFLHDLKSTGTKYHVMDILLDIFSLTLFENILYCWYLFKKKFIQERQDQRGKFRLK
jgi:hypothetical protein